jgi:hypothetical protein
MVVNFAGGIRDSVGLRGYLEVTPGDVVAVDLANGSLLWRRDRIGRPIAASARRLIALDRDGKEFVLRLIDAANGADVGRIRDFGMPDWAAQAGISADAVAIDASEMPAGIQLTWRLRRPYRGGAPPPPHIEARSSDEATGSVVVDPATARVIPAAVPAQGSAASSVQRIAPRDLGPHAKPAPDIFALDRVGDRLFALKVGAAVDHPGVMLEASDARDGTLLWRTPLTTGPVGRPTPQRK